MWSSTSCGRLTGSGASAKASSRTTRNTVARGAATSGCRTTAIWRLTGTSRFATSGTEDELDDCIDWIDGVAWTLHHDAEIVLGEFRGASGSEEAGAANPGPERRKQQRRIRCVAHVDIAAIAFPRRDAPPVGRDPTAAR